MTMKLKLIYETIKKPQWFYHGTTKRGYKDIMNSGYLKPNLADNEEFGIAIWFSAEYEEAADFARNGGVVLAINIQDLSRFKWKYTTTLPSTMANRYNKLPKFKNNPLTADDFPFPDLVVYDKIPLKYLRVVKSEMDT